jgi:hypothetical protein
MGELARGFRMRTLRVIRVERFTWSGENEILPGRMMKSL